MDIDYNSIFAVFVSPSLGKNPINGSFETARHQLVLGRSPLNRILPLSAPRPFLSFRALPVAIFFPLVARWSVLSHRSCLGGTQRRRIEQSYRRLKLSPCDSFYRLVSNIYRSRFCFGFFESRADFSGVTSRVAIVEWSQTAGPRQRSVTRGHSTGGKLHIFPNSLSEYFIGKTSSNVETVAFAWHR